MDRHKRSYFNCVSIPAIHGLAVTQNIGLSPGLGRIAASLDSANEAVAQIEDVARPRLGFASLLNFRLGPSIIFPSPHSREILVLSKGRIDT